MITIDGSFGEGGGQIIRTSLALSLITGKPFTVERIRSGRKRPGLLRQHLTAVNAARDTGKAHVVGNRLGSQTLTFVPTAVRGGIYHFDVGSAGSCTLVLQTVLPALVCAAEPSRLTLEGGTHNPMAPPFDFLEQAFLPILNRMGPHVSVTLARPGFYPAGGGRFDAVIEPVPALTAMDLSERGALRRTSAQGLVANLPRSIAEREVQVARTALRLRKSASKAVEVDAHGPGNVLLLTVDSEQVTEVFTGFGERGVRAETVADRTVKSVQQYLESAAAVGTHLADQLLIPFAISGSGQFTTLPPTPHTTTNIAIIQKFLDVEIELGQIKARTWRVRVSSRHAAGGVTG